MNKPFAPACERNKQAILEVIQPLLLNKKALLEVGSGTGQHAVHIAKALPNLTWQTADLNENHAGINAWIADSYLTNVLSPITFDAALTKLPKASYDCVYTANTFHIMSWENVCRAIEQIGLTLIDEGVLIVYGPFKFSQQFTSTSDNKFDQQLREEAPHMGIRDYEAIIDVCEKCDIAPSQVIPMPANNFILTFSK